MNVAAYVVAVVLSVLAALGVVFAGLSELDALALAVAVFALAHILPR